VFQPILGESPAVFSAETGRLRWKLPALAAVMVSVKAKP